MAGAAYDTHGARNREGYELRFLSNIDPTCVAQALEGLDPERTLVVVVSKSWTTAETQRNAAQARDWLREGMASWRVSDDELVKKHFVACASTDKLDAVAAWGIEPSRNFEFWDWVGGRYSTCASAGVLPLALVYGPAVVREFLAGAHSIDRHFASAPLERNLPALMALLGLWNANFLGFGARAVVPYADALRRFPAHVQQLEMESNGKAVTLGVPAQLLDGCEGRVVFGGAAAAARVSLSPADRARVCPPIHIPPPLSLFLSRSPARKRRDRLWRAAPTRSTRSSSSSRWPVRAVRLHRVALP